MTASSRGEYEIGAMCGFINGGVNSDFIDFGDNAEMEEAFGEGPAGTGTPELRALAVPRRRMDLRRRAAEVSLIALGVGGCR